MAATSAGSGTSSGAAVTISPCDTFKIRNSHASTVLTISVNGLHEGSDVDLLAAGEKEYYRLGTNEQHIVVLSGGATYVYSIVVRRSK